MAWSSTAFLVLMDDGDFAIVTLNKSGSGCSTCKKSKCIHYETINSRSVSGEFGDLPHSVYDALSQVTDSSSHPASPIKTISKSPISFPIQPKLQSVMALSSHQKLATREVDRKANCPILRPAAGDCCAKCKNDWIEVNAHRGTIPFVDRKGTFDVVGKCISLINIFASRKIFFLHSLFPYHAVIAYLPIFNIIHNLTVI